MIVWAVSPDVRPGTWETCQMMKQLARWLAVYDLPTLAESVGVLYAF